MSEEKKTIILGVTGGIAAYKSADLCSKPSKKYNVLVIMPANARKLISEKIFYTLSGNPVLLDVFDSPEPRPAHVAWSSRADLMVVAPATANFIGKYTYGIADDALTTTALAYRGTMLLAPAMNCNMLQSPAVQENLETLRKRGVLMIGPDSGHLACGTSGAGRMSEPADIAEQIDKLLAAQ